VFVEFDKNIVHFFKNGKSSTTYTPTPPPQRAAAHS
jgi:hypothetical protein